MQKSFRRTFWTLTKINKIYRPSLSRIHKSPYTATGFPVSNSQHQIKFFTTQSSTPNTQQFNAQKPPQSPPPGKFKQLWRKYGVVSIVTYFSIYVGTLSCMYLAISYGLIGSMDALSLIQKLGLDKWIDISVINPKLGNFGLAWVLTKFTEPLRLGITALITPFIARLLGRVEKVDQQVKDAQQN